MLTHILRRVEGEEDLRVDRVRMQLAERSLRDREMDGREQMRRAGDLLRSDGPTSAPTDHAGVDEGKVDGRSRISTGLVVILACGGRDGRSERRREGWRATQIE